MLSILKYPKVAAVLAAGDLFLIWVVMASAGVEWNAVGAGLLLSIAGVCCPQMLLSALAASVFEARMLFFFMMR